MGNRILQLSFDLKMFCDCKQIFDRNWPSLTQICPIQICFYLSYIHTKVLYHFSRLVNRYTFDTIVVPKLLNRSYSTSNSYTNNKHYYFRNHAGLIFFAIVIIIFIWINNFHLRIIVQWFAFGLLKIFLVC